MNRKILIQVKRQYEASAECEILESKCENDVYLEEWVNDARRMFA